MAELPNRVKGFRPLETDEFKRCNSEFNPRAAAAAAAPLSSTGAAADHPPWPVNNIAPPFSADPIPDSALHAASKWWVSPSRTSPTAVFAAAACLPNHTVEGVDHARLSVAHDNGGASVLVKDALQFAMNGLSRNNPYLDAALRSPTASFCQMPQHQVSNGTSDDWSGNGSFSARNATFAHTTRPGFDQDVFHPVFADHSAYPVLQPARASYNFPQVAAANRPPMCPNYANMMSGGDCSFKAGDEQYGWGSTDQVRNAVAKSQSMRALYEENAALRRALLSMRRGSLFAMQGVEQVIPGEQDRYLASDVAEGRALSMRERGRWAMQAGGEGGVVQDGSCSMWAGTPGQLWPARPPLAHGVQAVAGTHRRQRTHHHNGGWEEVAAEHPLYYGGGSFGGWPDDSMCGTGEYPHWGEAPQNDCQSGSNAPDEAVSGEGTSLKQLLVESDRMGMNGNKWRRQGKKKAAHTCEEEVGKHATEEEGQCAMCGGKLRNVEVIGAKKAGLPLRLCPACHPRAAASLPHSTTIKSPPLSSQTSRHHVATALFMACRPNATNLHVQEEPKYAPKKIKPKNRIVDLCRHFVGLAAKTPPTP